MTSRTSPRVVLLFVAYLSALLWGAVPPAIATDSQWNVNADGNWSDPANWTADVPDGVDDVARLTYDLSRSRTVTIDGAARTVGSLYLEDDTDYYRLSGEGLNLDVSAGSALIQSDGSVQHNIWAPLTLYDSLSVDVNGKGLRITEPISSGVASTGLLKRGSGHLELSGASTYTGETVIEEGTLGAVPGALGSANAGTIVQSGAALELRGDSYDEPLSLIGAGPDGNGALRVGGRHSWNAPITLAGDTTVFSSYLLTLNGPISDSGAGHTLTKIGSQGMILGDGTSFSGSLVIAEGWVQMGADVPTGNIAMGDGGFLDLRGGAVLTRALGSGPGEIQWTGSGGLAAADGKVTVNLGGQPTPEVRVWGAPYFVPDGADLVLGLDQSEGEVEIRNPIDMAGAARTISVTPHPDYRDGAASLSGGLSNGGLVKDGPGRLILRAPSTYSGPTTIREGRLELEAPSALGNTSSVAVEGSLYLNEYDVHTNTITVRGGGQVHGTTGVLIADLYELESGTLRPILAGSGTLRKTTTELGTVSGTSPDFTGPVEVLEGRLEAWGSDGLGSPAVGTYVAPGASLVAGLPAEPVVLGAPGAAEPARLDGRDPGPGGGGWGGPVTLAGPADLEGSISGVISGDGALLVSDGLYLKAANIYSSETVIDEGGKVRLYHPDGLGATTSGTTVSQGGALHVWDDVTVTGEPLVLDGGGLSGQGTYAGPIRIVNSTSYLEGGRYSTLTVAGTITTDPGVPVRVTGEGRLLLTGTNTYTGPTEVRGATLRASDGVGLPSGSNLVLDDGMFEPDGPTVFVRPLGDGPGEVHWKSGGFVAHGGNVAVNIGGQAEPETLTWGSEAFVWPGLPMVFGSETADSEVEVRNPIDLAGGRRLIEVIDNPDSTTDAVNFTGPFTNGELHLLGNGTVVFSGPNMHTGGTGVYGVTLRPTVPEALPPGGAVTVKGKLDLGAMDFNLTGPVRLAGGTIKGTGTLTGPDIALKDGTLDVNVTGDISLVVNGVIPDYVPDNPPDEVIIVCPCTYTGETRVESGKLTLVVDEVLPDTTHVVVGENARFLLNEMTETIGSLEVLYGADAKADSGINPGRTRLILGETGDALTLSRGAYVGMGDYLDLEFAGESGGNIRVIESEGVPIGITEIECDVDLGGRNRGLHVEDVTSSDGSDLAVDGDIRNGGLIKTGPGTVLFYGQHGGSTTLDTLDVQEGKVILSDEDVVRGTSVYVRQGGAIELADGDDLVQGYQSTTTSSVTVYGGTLHLTGSSGNHAGNWVFERGTHTDAILGGEVLVGGGLQLTDAAGSSADVTIGDDQGADPVVRVGVNSAAGIDYRARGDDSITLKSGTLDLTGGPITLTDATDRFDWVGGRLENVAAFSRPSTTSEAWVEDVNGGAEGQLRPASPTLAAGRVGAGALDFANPSGAENNHVDFGDLDLGYGEGRFSVSLWFNRRTDRTGDDTNHHADNVMVAQSSDPSNDNFEIGSQGDAVEFYLDTSPTEPTLYTYSAPVPGGITNGAWYHVAFTYDDDLGGSADDTAKVYVNGDLIGAFDGFDGTLDQTGSSPFTVGISRPGGSAWGDFDGLIDEVAVWEGTALTDLDVRALYNGGAGSNTAPILDSATFYAPLDEILGAGSSDAALHQQGGVMVPGGSIGTSTINGDYSVGDGAGTPDASDPLAAVWEIELDPSAAVGPAGPFTQYLSDYIDVNGNLVLEADSVLALLDITGEGFAGLTRGHIFIIAEYESLVGTFGAVEGLNESFVGYNFEGSNRIAVMPEPAALALLGVGGLGALALRRRR